MVAPDLPQLTVQFAEAVSMTPLDAQAGVEAIFSSGLGTLIQFALLLMSTLLTVGALIVFGMAGLSRMSQDSGKQAKTSSYVAAAGVMLGCAIVLGAGPEVLSALGFETMDQISAVNVFSG